MTNPNLSLIAVVLDRSGSMAGIRDELMQGFNNFLADRCKDPGDVRMTLARFDNVYELVYNDIPVTDVKPLDADSFAPRGSTALLDAIGKTVSDIGKALTAKPENERPGKVCVMILTDGDENSSKTYVSAAQIKKMVEVQRSQYNWEFIFLGASLDAIGTSTAMGMSQSTSMSYTASGKGILRAFNATSNMVGAASAGATYQSMSYSDKDRAENAPPTIISP